MSPQDCNTFPLRGTEIALWGGGTIMILEVAVELSCVRRDNGVPGSPTPAFRPDP